MKMAASFSRSHSEAELITYHFRPNVFSFSLQRPELSSRAKGLSGDRSSD